MSEYRRSRNDADTVENEDHRLDYYTTDTLTPDTSPDIALEPLPCPPISPLIGEGGGGGVAQIQWKDKRSRK
jgi:hypothetical protein